MTFSYALKLECTLMKLQEGYFKGIDYIFKSSCGKKFICTHMQSLVYYEKLHLIVI